MGINKIVYNGGTLIDLTGDTVTADKLAQGYTAHDRTGTVIIGTATGGAGAVVQDENGGLHFLEDGVNAFSDAITTLPNGGLYHVITGIMASGGGLEYEEGTYVPTTDETAPAILFTNTHTTAPFFAMCVIQSGESITTGNVLLMSNFVNWFVFKGSEIIGGTLPLFGLLSRRYVNSAGTSMSGGTNTVASEDYLPTYITSSAFYPQGAGGTQFLLANRTYKWIAVWAPTT